MGDGRSDAFAISTGGRADRECVFGHKNPIEEGRQITQQLADSPQLPPISRSYGRRRHSEATVSAPVLCTRYVDRVAGASERANKKRKPDRADLYDS